MNTAAMFSSATDQWATPPLFFERWDGVFRFTLDVCADASNAKCARYFTREQDGLHQAWAPEICWMNPPYGREIGRWVRKAYEESHKGATVVCLLPARTDTAWWHDYVMKHASITFIRGRLKFGDAKSGAPFPSVIATFLPESV